MATELVVAVFPNREVLNKALDYLSSLKDFKIHRAAVVAKTKGQAVVIGDDISSREASLVGMGLGAFMTSLGFAVMTGTASIPGVGMVMAAGAGALVGGLLGGATGHFASVLMDNGFKSSQVDLLAERLEKDHAALVLEIDNENRTLDRLRKELAPYSADLVERLKDANAGRTSKR
jgi:uncharacterized membrane protein